MFHAVSVADLRAIADMAAAVFRDDQAMQEYLHPGSTDPGSFRPTYASEIHREAQAGRFDSPERVQFKEFIAALSAEARHEVIAVIDVGRDIVADVDKGRRKARHMPDEYQMDYIQNRTFSYLRKGLDKLGISV